MQPTPNDLERLRQEHNRQYPKAEIGPILDELAAAEHLAFTQFLWDGTGRPIAPGNRKAIEEPPTEGAFY